MLACELSQASVLWACQPKGHTFLVTGSAGFIGFHVARTLLTHGARLVGLDNFNDY